MKKASWLIFLLLAVVAAGVWLGAAQSADKAKDPVCGMMVDKAAAKWTYAYQGTTYYFCGESCQKAFIAAPEKYLTPKAETKPMGGMMGQGMMHAKAAAPGQAVDPVCGMSVDKATAKWKTDYKGVPYYFCSEVCQTMFIKEPEKYLAAQAEGEGSMNRGQGMAGGGMMDLPDVERKIETVKDGIVITMTSKNPDTVKKLHEHAKKMADAKK
jgi:YHS domain-containing protein